MISEVVEVRNLLMQYQFRYWDQQFCLNHPQYEVDDPSLLVIEDATAIENAFWDDDRPLIYPRHIYELKEQLFPFGYKEIDVPDEIQDDLDDEFTHIPIAFFVPEIVPMINEGWIDQEMLSFDYSGDGRLHFEFLYLPDTKMAIDEDSLKKDFGNQPGCFAVFIWDENGGPEAESYIKFYKVLKAFGLYLYKKIQEYKERSIHIA